MEADPSEKDLGAIKVSLGKCRWEQRNETLHWPVTFHKGTASGEDWANLQRAIGAMRLNAVGDATYTYLSYPLNPSVTPEEVNAEFICRVIPRMPGTPVPVDAPDVASFSLDVPTAAQMITVPVEFHDLPLP
jgi:hypothetical protein